MVRSQRNSSKKPKRTSIDFKKMKHKVGRKLPPPKNATNVEIKSKAIILSEQSVASERSGLAVNRRGLTLIELLRQTAHHNGRIRKDALVGLRDLALKHPAELRLHKLAIIEKLRERISDDDKLVRETLYQLLKSVILPRLKEDIPGPIVSLIMVYIFNAMTHLAIDIRLMAFKIFDLIVMHYPSSFFLYAERVLQNYEDILRNNHIYWQARSKLKDTLLGLVHCLSLLYSDKEKGSSSYEQREDVRGPLHAFEPELPKKNTVVSPIFKKLEDLVPILLSCWHEFAPLFCTTQAADTEWFDCMLCIIQSIKIAVKFMIEEGINRHRAVFGFASFSLHKGPDGTKWIESILPTLVKKLLQPFPLSPSHQSTEKEDDQYFTLNVGITEIFLQLSEWFGIHILPSDKFLEFIENALSLQISSRKRSNKVLREKQLTLLLPFIPMLIFRVTSNWKSRLMQAFTRTFKGCKADSLLNLACLSLIEEMLLPKRREGTLFSDANIHDMLEYQISWIQKLPELLLRLGSEHPSVSKTVLQLQLHIGQCAPTNSALMQEYDNMQGSLREFYCRHSDEGTILYGPFIKLPRECQDLAICCLYYFTNFDSLLLESLACCCLCDHLEPFVMFRTIEVLHSAYKAGHMQIADQISFFVTLLTRFKVVKEISLHGIQMYGDKCSNFGTFKAITSAVCSCLSQMGDSAFVLQILEKFISNELSHRPSLYNLCAILRLLVALGSKPLKLSEDCICILSDCLSGYLINVALYMQENDSGATDSGQMCVFQYYIRSCILLFDRSNRLLTLVLNLLASSISPCNSLSPHRDAQYSFEHINRICSITCILIHMHRHAKFHRSLSSCKDAVMDILRNILIFQASNETNPNYEERMKIQNAFNELKIETDRLYHWDADDLKRISEGK